MRDLHQTLTTGKSPGAKVSSDTEGHHRDLIQHGDSQRLIHLIGRQKLRLVNEHAGETGG